MSLFDFYLTKTSSLVKSMYRDYWWQLPVERDTVYLTFDDGPHPEITPWVLDQLKEFDARATFFCLGKNVLTHPAIFQRIKDEGHAVGNHTQSHLNGWSFNNYKYARNVLEADQLIQSPLFRPPFGKIKRSQAKLLSGRFHIVMWDVLPWDFKKNITPQRCLDNITGHTEPGSIVVLHDSDKAWRNLSFALPKALEYFREKGYTVAALPNTPPVLS